MDYAAGGRLSVDEMSSGHRCLSDDSITELRSYGQVENGTPSTSPPYWDTDNDDDDGGPKPSALYGKFTWKIEKFSQINKRELRSNAFEVGGYKWCEILIRYLIPQEEKSTGKQFLILNTHEDETSACFFLSVSRYILIYPQGCDVCNHLSLFLCVANYDKLLPGWSHFAQFTIAVVNKDPKKSKYSDTLHRFCKKEHDWGWKKFIEISKILDGFINDDSLVIKAQVQVIREKAHRPFRCLDCQYRRELVRVYLPNVEQICRRYIEDKKGKLSNLIEDKVAWSSFRAFWLGMDEMSRWHLSRDRTDSVLKLVVKHFFVEKEVTSMLVMDSLYSGLKALECSKNKKGKMKLVEGEELAAPIIYSEDDNFVLADNVLLLLERVALGPVPLQPSTPKDDKGSQNRTKDGGFGEEFYKDTIEHDESRLIEFGWRTLEFYVLDHIFSARIDAAYKESVALKIQEELIREEEAAEQAGNEIKAKRNTAEKEKRTKKKQAKQKRNNRRVRDRARVETSDRIMQDKQHEQSPSDESLLEEFSSKKEPIVIEKFCSPGNASDTSDTGDDVTESIQPDLDERDCNPVNWDTNALEIHSNMEADYFVTRNGQSEMKTPCVVDDSSSTCSTDSIPSVVTDGLYKGNPLHNSRSPNRGKNQRGRDAQNRPPSDASHLGGATVSCMTLRPETETLISLTDKRRFEHRLVEKEEAVVPQKELNVKDKVDVELPSISRTANNSENATATTITMRTSTIMVDTHLSSQAPSTISVRQETRSPQVFSSKSEAEKLSTPTKPNTITTQHVTSISRPSSAPLIPIPRPTVPIETPVQSAPLLSRSISAVGRLGTDPSPSAPPFIPQSYRNAITSRNDMAPIPSNFSYPSLNPSTQAFISSIRPGLMFGSMDRFLPQRMAPDEFPHLDIINDLLDEDKNIAHAEENLHYHHPHHHQNHHVVNTFSSPCHFDGDFQSHNIYSSSSRDAQYSQVDRTTYANGQFQGLIDQNQWPYNVTDLSMLSLGNSTNAGGYSYQHSDYTNGYMYTWPGNGH